MSIDTAHRRRALLSADPPRFSARSRGLWWLHPIGVVLLVVPVSLALAWWYPDEVYRQAWRTAKSLTTQTVLDLTTAVVVFVAVAALTSVACRSRSVHNWPEVPGSAAVLLRKAHAVLFALTLAGYAALLVAAVARGFGLDDLVGRFAGSSTSADQMKDQFAPITGVTSLTQMGIAFVVVTGLLLLASARRADAFRLGVVLALAVARAFLASERLAILELVLPLVAMIAMALAASRLRPVLRVLPLVLLPLAVVIFSLFEYARSWTFYRAQSDGGFIGFALERFSGYYVTAYNNGQLLLDFGERGVPYLTIQGLWEAPGVQQSGLYQALNQADPPNLFVVLRAYGNPEFNNQCGICLPFHDFGYVGALVFFAAAAVLVTLAYIGFRDSHPVGLLLYPVLFTGLWELPRYLYWTQGRAIPALVVLGLLGALIARSIGRAPTEAPEGPAYGSPGVLATRRVVG